MWTKSSLVLVLAAALAIAACNQTTGGGPPRMAQTSTEVAGEVCEINALAEEHHAMTSRIGSIESGAPTDYNDESWTILLEKLKNYRAEIDATYRFVAMNCKAYNMCMQANKYVETACSQSRGEWSKSHDKFNQLALDLAQLEVPPHHPPHKPCGPGCKPPVSTCGSGCNVQGGVFSTGCSPGCKSDGD